MKLNGRIASLVILFSFFGLLWGISAVVDQLTLIQATDTIGNSRLTINSNDVILANNIDSNAASSVSITVTGGTPTSIDFNDSGTITWDLQAATGVAANVNVTAPYTWSGGIQDFSAITQFTMPNLAVPALFAVGEMALDTTIGSHQPMFEYHDGGESMTIIAIDTAELPALDNEIIAYDSGTSKFVLEAPAGGGGGGTVQDANLTITATDTGLVAYTTVLGDNSVDLQTVRAVGGSNPALAQMNQGDHSSILGGLNNQITTNLDHCVIVGGSGNQITSDSATASPGGFIGGGINNTLDSEGDNNTIVGGSGNAITGTTAPDESFIGGGNGNSISAGTIETIVGGAGNSITAGSHSFIGGGSGNNKTASGQYDVIVGGLNNDITITGGRSAILGGENNTAEGPFSVIIGGENNKIGDNTSDYNVILAGGGPTVGLGCSIDPNDAQHCLILGGQDNDMDPVGNITFCLAWGDNVDVTDNSGDFCVGFGQDITLAHENCTVFNDGEAGQSTSTAEDNEMILDFGSGVRVVHHFERSVLAGQTADVGSAQGGLAITTDVIEISTVGTIGDSTTLPAAVAGLEVFIINNGANACDVFPASGDNLGAGADTAASLAAGNNITYVAYDATNWEVK